MIRKLAASVALALMCFAMAVAGIEDQVLSPSCCVLLKGGTWRGGSATLFRAGDAQYAITAGHVIDGEQSTVEVDVTNDKGMTEKKKKEFWNPVWLEQSIYCNSQEVKLVKMRTEVVAFSPPEEQGGLDIGVLRVLAPGKESAMWLSGKAPSVGGDVFHVGSLYGDITGALCKGSILRVDFTISDAKMHGSFDVLHLGGAAPGSSGGGVFVRRGDKLEWIGMVVRGYKNGLLLMHNAEHVKKFLVDNKLGAICGVKEVAAKACDCTCCCKCGKDCKCTPDKKCCPECKCGDPPRDKRFGEVHPPAKK